MMKGNIQSADHCPHCRQALEIIGVKFKLTGAAVISTCANCGMAMAENSNKPGLMDRLAAIVARIRRRVAEPRSTGSAFQNVEFSVKRRQRWPF